MSFRSILSHTRTDSTNQLQLLHFLTNIGDGGEDECLIADTLRVIAHCSGARRQKAIKFTYDIMNEKWQTENTYVTIAEVRFVHPHARKQRGGVAEGDTM